MRRTTIALALSLLLLPSLAQGAGFRVVVNKDNPTTTISSEDLSALMMKKTPRWSDGTPVVPVDQVESTAARAAFTTTVLRKSPAAVKSYWRQQIFSGRETPPVEKRNDEEVLRYVRANRGAVGYVSEGASVGDVRVIEIR